LPSPADAHDAFGQVSILQSFYEYLYVQKCFAQISPVTVWLCNFFEIEIVAKVDEINYSAVARPWRERQLPMAPICRAGGAKIEKKD